MFTEESKEHVRKMREKFYKTGDISSIEGVRPEILHFWKEAREKGLEPDKPYKPFISKGELTARINSQKLFYNIGLTYLENLYGFLKGSGFIVALTDADGCILKIIGDKNTIEAAKENLLFEGSYRDKRALGTSIISACINYHKPIQMNCTEHYFPINDDWSGSSAPIFSLSNGKFIGMVSIHGNWKNSHEHTLGMAVLAAEAISKQLELEKINAKITKINIRLDKAIESLNYGIIYIDQNGCINHINSTALNLLNIKDLKKCDLIGNYVFNYLGDEKLDINFILKKVLKDKVYENEIYSKRLLDTLICTYYPMNEDENKNIEPEYIITIREQKQVHKMVNKIVGSSAKFTFNDIVGNSDILNSIKKMAKKVAKYNSTVLLIGESGTGKELFAQAIHNESQHSKGPFVAINCGAIPRSLIESELFGYEAGAFTGADKTGRAGKFELANEGTIFLDEIGDMPYDVQVTLLKVLQDREVIRIGGKKPIKINVNVIAATNKNLEECIANNTFRNDLYYRLNVFNIKIPSLKSRKEDISILANYFISKYRNLIDKQVYSISDEALQILEQYPWPGNIRELENVMERALLVADTKQIEAYDLPSNIISYEASNKEIETEITNIPKKTYAKPMHSFESDIIRDTIFRNKGNIKKSAEELKISRPTLYRKLEKYNIKY